MSCENCTCPGCTEKLEIDRLIDSSETMAGLPQRVFDYWDRNRDKETLARIGRTVHTYVHDGRIVKQVTTDISTTRGDLTQRALEFWNQKRAEEALAYPGGTVHTYIHDGQLVKRVTTKLLTDDKTDLEAVLAYDDAAVTQEATP